MKLPDTRKREYAITLTRCNGGEIKTVKIIAFSSGLAAFEATQQNPTYVATATRVIRIIKRDKGD